MLILVNAFCIRDAFGFFSYFDVAATPAGLVCIIGHISSLQIKIHRHSKKNVRKRKRKHAGEAGFCMGLLTISNNSNDFNLNFKCLCLRERMREALRALRQKGVLVPFFAWYSSPPPGSMHCMRRSIASCLQS